tara:strand:+ start:669 stop:1727 length:1059 start_codon:yes stop_codon:yes gene_type:complete
MNNLKKKLAKKYTKKNKLKEKSNKLELKKNANSKKAIKKTIKKHASNYKKTKTKKIKGGTEKRKLEELNIKPTGDETLWEAYQAIFAFIMNAEPDSPYSKLCEIFNIKLTRLDENFDKSFNNYENYDIQFTSRIKKKYTDLDDNKYIFFIPKISEFSQIEETHYIAFKDGNMLNPYSYFQADDTQGFCQMFAFLLAEFGLNYLISKGYKLHYNKRFTTAEIFNNPQNNYIQNTIDNNQLCANESINLILKYPEVYKKFESEFDNLIFDKEYGIEENTSLETYFKQFLEINKTKENVKAYVLDNPIYKWQEDDKNPYYDKDGLATDAEKRDTWLIDRQKNVFNIQTTKKRRTM